MTLKYCRVCQRDTVYRNEQCVPCAEKVSKVKLEDLESLELIDRVRRLEKLVDKNIFGTQIA